MIKRSIDPLLKSRGFTEDRKKYDSRIPVFPVWKKGIKILYRSAGNRIPVAGLFHITFFGHEYSTRI